MKRVLSGFALTLFSLVIAFAGTLLAGTPAQKSVPPQKTPPPKFKAIWEPVNYKEDLPLYDVFFVSKDEGWVSGAAGTVLHTKDGGTTWTAELGGDPHAEGAELGRVFFTDATHGWVQTGYDHPGGALFRTTDGGMWQQVTGDIRGNVVFVSDTKGFYVYGPRIYATTDGGKNWTQPFSCRAKMEVNGLTQEKSCDVRALNFPTATIGYGVGEARVTVKTEDGGSTWNVLVGPEEPGDQRGYDVFFLDANMGYEVRSSGLYRTTDGGQSWQGVIAHLESGYPKVKFADKEVGWSCLGGTWAYTVDGGKHWTTRQVRFPTGVTSFSLPTRDRGYVVGDHGMIYRYRIVPADYTSKGMIEAPMMPAAAADQSSSNDSQPEQQSAQTSVQAKPSAKQVSLTNAPAAAASSDGPSIEFSRPRVNGLSVSMNGLMVSRSKGAALPDDCGVWSFGDGSAPMNSCFPARHTYARAGTYHVTATVTDTKGQSASASTDVTVQ